MEEVGESSRVLTSTPSSSTSGCLSNDESSEDHLLPSSLAAEELQLALNKEATEEELLKAITRCKDLVLESVQASVERKWLVRHLIELRLRLQECREAMMDPQHPRNKSSGVSRRTVRGHHLNLQPLLKTTTSKYCDHCTGTIWSVVQAWYECEDCGYSCHHKCISQILRECAHVVASERGGYVLDICPEEGLSAQKYLCAECGSPLPLSLFYTQISTALKITRLDVPKSAWDAVNLNCKYDLEDETLYAVKWYKDNQEFLRCCGNGTIIEYPLEDIKVYHTGRSQIGSCFFELTALTPKSGGDYTCEVNLEWPTFQFVRETAHLNIIEPLKIVQPEATTVEEIVTLSVENNTGSPSWISTFNFFIVLFVIYCFY